LGSRRHRRRTRGRPSAPTSKREVPLSGWSWEPGTAITIGLRLWGPLTAAPGELSLIKHHLVPRKGSPLGAVMGRTGSQLVLGHWVFNSGFSQHHLKNFTISGQLLPARGSDSRRAMEIDEKNSWGVRVGTPCPSPSSGALELGFGERDGAEGDFASRVNRLSQRGVAELWGKLPYRALISMFVTYRTSVPRPGVPRLSLGGLAEVCVAELPPGCCPLLRFGVRGPRVLANRSGLGNGALLPSSKSSADTLRSRFPGEGTCGAVLTVSSFLLNAGEMGLFLPPPFRRNLVGLLTGCG